MDAGERFLPLLGQDDPMGAATAALEARRRQQVTDAGYDPDKGLYDRYSAMLGTVLGPTIAQRSGDAMNAMRRGDMGAYQKIATDLSLDFGGFLGSIKGVGGGVPPHLRPGVEPPTQHNPRGLPMDEASAMARAKEMGFTQPSYHATYDDFPAFDYSKLGENTRQNVEGLSNERWAMNLARSGAWSAQAPVGGPRQMQADVELPLLLKGKPGKTYKSLDQLEAAIRRAGGPDRFREKMRTKGVGHIAVKDEEFRGTSFVSMAPEYIRSRFATFDPERAHLPDLLASHAPWLALLGGGAAAMIPGEAEAAP